jgi:hypothetical protein
MHLGLRSYKFLTLLSLMSHRTLTISRDQRNSMTKAQLAYFSLVQFTIYISTLVQVLYIV